MVARWAHNPKVIGSNPFSATTSPKHWFGRFICINGANTNRIIKTKETICGCLFRFGDSGATRTLDLLLRRQLLYPAELRNRPCDVYS